MKVKAYGEYITMDNFFNIILYGNLDKLIDTSLLYKGSDNIISLYFTLLYFT